MVGSASYTDPTKLDKNIMSIGYELINQTKKEKISFYHLPVNTKKEIAGNPVSASIVSWYILDNQGDEI